MADKSLVTELWDRHPRGLLKFSERSLCFQVGTAIIELHRIKQASAGCDAANREKAENNGAGEGIHAVGWKAFRSKEAGPFCTRRFAGPFCTTVASQTRNREIRVTCYRFRSLLALLAGTRRRDSARAASRASISSFGRSSFAVSFGSSHSGLMSRSARAGCRGGSSSPYQSPVLSQPQHRQCCQNESNSDQSPPKTGLCRSAEAAARDVQTARSGRHKCGEKHRRQSGQDSKCAGIPPAGD